jgi:hypothetical protein
MAASSPTTSTDTIVFSVRIDPGLLARVESNAKRAGENRNAYILGWLNYACDTSCVFAGETGATYKRRVTRGFQPAPDSECPQPARNGRVARARA